MTVAGFVLLSTATGAAKPGSLDQICAVTASSNFRTGFEVSGLPPSAFDLSWQNLALYDKYGRMSTTGSHFRFTQSTSVV